KKQIENLKHMTQIASLIQIKDTQIAEYFASGDNEFKENYQTYQSQLEDLADDFASTLHNEKAKSLFSEIQENNEAVDKLFLKDIAEAVAKHYIKVTSNLQKD